MSIKDYGSNNENIKESIESIRQRIKRKRNDAIDFLKSVEEASELDQNNQQNINNSVLQEKAVGKFKVIHNNISNDDEGELSKRNKHNKKADIMQNSDLTSAYVPIVKRILSTKSV